MPATAARAFDISLFARLYSPKLTASMKIM